MSNYVQHMYPVLFKNFGFNIIVVYNMIQLEKLFYLFLNLLTVMCGLLLTVIAQFCNWSLQV